jgi:hypothetical protein
MLGDVWVSLNSAFDFSIGRSAPEYGMRKQGRGWLQAGRVSHREDVHQDLLLRSIEEGASECYNAGPNGLQG